MRLHPSAFGRTEAIVEQILEFEVKMIEQRVCNGKQPRLAVRSRGKALELTERTEERLLRQVPRIVLASCQTLGDREDRPKMWKSLALEPGSEVVGHTDLTLSTPPRRPGSRWQ